MFKEAITERIKQKQPLEDFHHLPVMAEKLFDRLAKRIQGIVPKSQ